MNDFTFYLGLGWHHIISWDALDHLLFIIALASIYIVSNWKQVLTLITAFTIGHSLTLALSIYKLVRINSQWVEFLIPVTIIITAFFNLFQKDYSPVSLRLNYFLALFFGLIHGLGFANTIRFILAKDQSITLPLLGFNIGLEVGQIAVVSIILFAGFLIINKIRLQQKWWVWFWSVSTLLIAANMVVDRWPF